MDQNLFLVLVICDAQQMEDRNKLQVLKLQNRSEKWGSDSGMDWTAFDAWQMTDKEINIAGQPLMHGRWQTKK